ncbi:MAG TPA: hypothetical protein VNW46_10645 [Gemmatimonadaceae bacterium]|jgi:hypothetical protein|nr:hypothetical protein [Gemmatimonadaceae bacterium]
MPDLPDRPPTAPLPAPLPNAPLPAVSSANVLDRAAVERVLARAAELQTQVPGDEPSDLISDEQLLAAGTEVGLSPSLIRQALAEERTRVAVPYERGLAAQVAGAKLASATRTVQGTPPEILAQLQQTMQRDESMMVKRRWADRITWEPRHDFWAAFRRLAPGGRAFDLFYANEVGATVVPVDNARVAVRLDADISRARTQRLEQGATVAVSGVAAGGGLIGLGVIAHVALLGALAGIAAVPAAAGLLVGFAVARSHRQVLERTQLALERILDRLEHGDLRRKP